MRESDNEFFKRYDRAHERLRALLGQLYEQEKLDTAFGWNSNPEKILDELEQALEGKSERQCEEIRQRWIRDHWSELH